MLDWMCNGQNPQRVVGDPKGPAQALRICPRLWMQGGSSSTSKAMVSVQGQQSQLICPVCTHHVRVLLEPAGHTDTQIRYILMCALWTVCQGSHSAVRNYIAPRDPHIINETYLAFGL